MPTDYTMSSMSTGRMHTKYEVDVLSDTVDEYLKTMGAA